MNYQDTRWLTFKQAQGLNGHVRKGEKSTPIVFWKQVSRREVPQEDLDDETNRRDTYWIARLYNVFNAEQTEDCTLAPLPEPGEMPDPIEEAEAIIRAMPDPPAISTYAQDQPGPPLRAPPGPGQGPHQGPLRRPGTVVQHHVP